MDIESQRGKMMMLRLQGKTYAEVAESLGCSRQNVQQSLAPMKRISLRIRRLAEGRCAGCGLKVGTKGQIHHKAVQGMTPETYNLPRNLALLCISCHRHIHAQTPPISLPHSVSTNEFLAYLCLYLPSLLAILSP